MPLFEFQCKACGHQFEELVRGHTEPTCPACHGRQLERMLSVFAVNTRGGSRTVSAGPGPCGTCGDPRGPGACDMN